MASDAMMNLEDARVLVLAHARSLPEETLPLTHALGRILSRDVFLDSDIPPSTSLPWMALPEAEGEGCNCSNGKPLKDPVQSIKQNLGDYFMMVFSGLMLLLALPGTRG